MPRDRLLLIDGHALVYRAFFAMPALTNTRGEMTNAAYGFTSMLLKVLADEHPTHAIAAFDPKGPTFRHDEDATYKAQRPSMPDDLRPQLPWSREICTSLSIPIVEVPGFEADDVIGTLSLQAEAAGLDTVILTGDLDALQLVTEHTVVYAPRRGITDTVTYDVAAVRERFGFEPPQMVDYKALRGDASDNIPGVPGVGEKTGMSLVAQFGDLDGVLAAIPDMKPGKLRDNLEAHADQARHSRYLATIRRDVDITLDIAAARLDGYDHDAVHEVFDRLEFRSLLPRLPQFDGVPVAPPVVEVAADPADVEVIGDPGETAAVVEKLRDGGHLALHSVADGDHLVGIAMAGLDGETAYYMNLGDTLDAAAPDAVASVAALLTDPTVAKHAYDVKREILLWARRGVTVAHPVFDLMLAAYLVNTRTRVASLSTLAKDLCGVDVTEHDALIGSGRARRAFGDMPVDEIAAHAGALAGVVGAVEASLRRQLEASDLTRLHDTMELPLVGVLADM